MFNKQSKEDKKAAKKIVKDQRQNVDDLSITIIRTTRLDAGFADCKWEITNGYGYLVKAGVFPGYNRTLAHARNAADKLRAKAGLEPVEYALETVNAVRNVA
ncbi:hypothetical protein OG785_33320 [Streptomyces sp. NBC_00006]|uniref:hypothetical protein n=1 Tax=Streptomyces sp. NBC_00006 TaxID=2975619 RepID=UPI00225300F9|nr:hypothetical protein [Streptomyces sp. NBC_00006]MCX5535420.1 hypothetical protein [Streptomyces sp. NBC_00006]